MRKKRALRIGCGFTLQRSGSCTVIAFLTKGTARRLKLKPGKDYRTDRSFALGRHDGLVPIAARTQTVSPAGELKLPIGRKVRKALGRAGQPVPVRFEGHGAGVSTALRQTLATARRARA